MTAYDLSRFAQCRTCFEPMCGILSVKAREECVGCGGKALNVINENPSEDLSRKYPRRKAARERAL